MTIMLAVAMAGSQMAAAETSLTPSPEPIPLTYFGMHLHRGHTGRFWPTFEIGSWRLWDAGVNWAKLEPEKSDWKFDFLDRDVERAQQHNISLILTLGRTPTWASSRPTEMTAKRAGVPGGAAEPRNVDDWSNYVRTVVSRYKGRIEAYEIWNEPNVRRFYTGSPEQLVELARQTYGIVKQIDPSALVVSPSAVGPNGVQWLDDFLAAGGGKYCDVIGFHFYTTPDPPEALLDRVQEVRQVMQRRGAGDKPLWNTETGWQRPNFPDDSSDAAGWVARTYILNWAVKIPRVYWYAWDDEGMGVRLSQGENIPTAAGRAYAGIEEWLLGSKMNSCKQGSDGVWVCDLTEKSGTPAWIAWSPDHSSIFSPPAAWHVRKELQLLAPEQPVSNDGKVNVGPVPVLLVAGQ